MIPPYGLKFQAMGLPAVVPLEPIDQQAYSLEDGEEEEMEDGISEETPSDLPPTSSFEPSQGPLSIRRQRPGPSDLQPMMDLLDEVERSCLGKSELSVRTSVRASVDRSVGHGVG